ncbi:MAG: hypothetical protein J0I40_05660 [Cellulomonas sp.]|uniref:AfsA-related hotdog domain-containing protein n=1 Tax=Cellulomonas sp. 73-92 TaxID=1895740 RepID=UPI000925B82B|nr:AfsA-related hotdog domain-containing protein [Cellulomonas sp. 73-92]MBN9374869.1 hypothetical protein [Cellulomonas sp.]OJV75947.1 MAG: hypothetical protein BGO37_06840 [Cellulomonas sp. 73-92]
MTTLQVASDAAGVAQVSFDRLVDRRLVHRRANAEVLLTDVRQLGPTLWVAGAQVPRGHRRLSVPDGRLSEVLGVEVVRQLGIAIAHLGYQVPRDWAFTLQSAWYTWATESSATMPHSGPLELVATVSIDDVSWRRGVFDGMRLDLTLDGAAGQVAAAGGSMRVLAPRYFQALRRNAPDPLTLSLSRDLERVLDSRAEGQPVTRLGYDVADPFFFDHEVDHLPGLLLVEAVSFLWRRHHPGQQMRALALDYLRFAEYEPAVGIERTAQCGLDRFAFIQGAHEVAHGLATSRPLQDVTLLAALRTGPPS